MINRIEFEGNLTRDIEIKTTQAGKKVTSFVLAQNVRRKENGEWVDAGVVFKKFQAWENIAEAVAGMKKGDRLTAVGHVIQTKWRGKDGEERIDEYAIVENLGIPLYKKKERGGFTQYASNEEVPF